MGGYVHNVKRYLSWSGEEWLGLFFTAVTGGVVLGLLRVQEGSVFSFGLAVERFLLSTISVFFLLSFLVLVVKLAGIRWGLFVRYEKYTIGLLLGLFVIILTFGHVPFFITGRFEYATIPNLRVGKFRATMVKNWEAALSAAAGPLALVLLTIPLHFFFLVTGAEFFLSLVRLCLFLAILTILPLPLVETANPYAVYMSRLESLQGSLPGFDIFFASRTGYFFLAGLLLCFSLLSLLFSPSFFMLFLSLLLGALSAWAYVKARVHFA